VRRARPRVRVAAAGLAAVLALAVPATALLAGMADASGAEGTSTTFPTSNPINLVVVPFVDCVSPNADGSTTATFGYYSFSRDTVNTGRGQNNQITPAKLDGPETTRFQPGLVQRAFKVTIPKGTTAIWSLNGFPASAPNAGSPNCSSGELNIVGFVNCASVNKDGSTTALFGYYDSVRGNTKIARGPQNNITPAAFDGPQTTVFSQGLQMGVFSLTIPKGASANWTVNGFPATAPNTWSPKCPPPVSLPQEGNGLGLVIGLVVAAGVGTVVIRRIIARAAHPEPF
jgi:hypothetical protein